MQCRENDQPDILNEIRRADASWRRELSNGKAHFDGKEEATVRNGGSLKGRISAYLIGGMFSVGA